MKNTNFKRIVSLFAVLVLLVSFMTITASAGTATDAKESVVAVINEDETGWGSGFAIGKPGEPVEFIVTNNHVVDGDLGCTTATVAFDLASNDFVTANVYFFDAETDIAILKLPQPTDKRKAMVLCPMKHVDLDDSFAALGYPGGQYTDWLKFNKDDITITKGGIKKSDRVNGQDVYMLDLDITHGNSGGPLVNSAGEVVGINTFGINENTYAIAIDELLKVIDTDRIPVTLHGNANWLLWVIIGIGALLVIVIVLIIVLVARKKSKKAENVYIPPVESVVDPTVYKQEPATPAAPAKASAKLTAIGGTLNGKRFSVSGAVKIGRDSSKCVIAYPVSTQGVSGVHCEVAFDGTVCYVKDLNSSYGTFTMDGKKLAPNTPQVLQNGDKFYLASPENTFEVRF